MSHVLSVTGREGCTVLLDVSKAGQCGYRGQREMSHALSVTGREGFTMLLRMERNLKLMNRLFLEFSIQYFRAVVNRGYRGSTVHLSYNFRNVAVTEDMNMLQMGGEERENHVMDEHYYSRDSGAKIPEEQRILSTA
jgi:hypothetical protein